MIPENIRQTLLRLIKVIPDNVPWAVDGSCSLSLQGIDVTPHDIDILTDSVNAYNIERVLEDFSVRKVKYGETEQWRSHFGIFQVNSVKVEIIGDLQSFRDGKWSDVQNTETVGIEYVDIGDARVPVVSLSYHESTGYLQRRLKRERQ